MEHLTLSIGIGLGISLLFAELFGLAAGGMIVPGYFALFLTHPVTVTLTIVCGTLTFLLVRLISGFVIVYGKRRTVLMILVGYLLGLLIPAVFPKFGAAVPSTELRVIGYIIPGLIAIWLDRQGFVETLATLLIASAVVRLVMILILGEDIRV